MSDENVLVQMPYAIFVPAADDNISRNSAEARAHPRRHLRGVIWRQPEVCRRSQRRHEQSRLRSVPQQEGGEAEDVVVVVSVERSRHLWAGWCPAAKTVQLHQVPMPEAVSLDTLVACLCRDV